MTKQKRPSKVRARKHLSADALFETVRRRFEKVPDPRPGEVEISLSDALMSGFAMFSLKDPSLLAFEWRRNNEAHNLRAIYGIQRAPCDTQMRDILDRVSPELVRPAFKDVFGKAQRGKALEPMEFMEGHYLLSLDGSQYFNSEKIHSPMCLQRTSKRGKTTYYLQILGAAIVHPDFKEVIALCPEMIIKQDGETKNDCERNAAKRFFEHLRREHPHLKLIVTEDALSPNAPHIRDLKRFNLRFILGVKPGDHTFLFHEVDKAVEEKRTTEFGIEDPHDPEVLHYFRFLNGVPLNESNQDLLVNFLEYWELRGDKVKHSFSWISDWTITRENAYQIMRGGRARWKIENETFNTLKNQGYHFEHNYGLGQKHLSTLFVLLMMLAFLVDQVQQLCCALFRSVWKKMGSKKNLWEHMRAVFQTFELESMEMLYRMLLSGYERPKPVILDTS